MARRSLEDERPEQNRRGGEEPDHDWRTPGILGSAPDSPQQPRGSATREEGGADVVDRVLFSAWSAHEAEPDHGESEPGQRKVDEEAPTPGRVVGQPPAGGRSEHRSRCEHGPQVPLPLAAPAGRNDVPDRGDRERNQAPGAEPLDSSSRDQHLHRRREAADDRAGREEGDPKEEERPAAVDVRQLAVERHGHRRAEHVRGEDPGIVLESAQVAHDAR